MKLTLKPDSLSLTYNKVNFLFCFLISCLIQPDSALEKGNGGLDDDVEVCMVYLLRINVGEIDF